MTQDRSRRGISARAVPIDTDAVAIERWVALAKLPQDLDMIVEADVARSFVPGILERFRSQGRPASVEDNDGETERRECGATMIAHTKARSEEHTSELQSLMRISYAVFSLNKKKTLNH